MLNRHVPMPASVGMITTVLTPPCMCCGERGTVVVPTDAHNRWRAGELAQVAFPDLTADVREQLISGTHPACWDAMFADA